MRAAIPAELVDLAEEPGARHDSGADNCVSPAAGHRTGTPSVLVLRGLARLGDGKVAGTARMAQKNQKGVVVGQYTGKVSWIHHPAAA